MQDSKHAPYANVQYRPTLDTGIAGNPYSRSAKSESERAMSMDVILGAYVWHD